MTTVTKSLAGLEDLLLGQGSVSQTRSGHTYPITKITLLWPCANEAELTSLDTEVIKYAYLAGAIYRWTGTTWVKDFSSHFRVDVPVDSLGAYTASIDLASYKSVTVKAYFTTTTAPISLMGYAFKNGLLYSAATVHNSGGYPGAGTLTLGIAGTNLTIAKTAGNVANPGMLTVELEGIVYA